MVSPKIAKMDTKTRKNHTNVVEMDDIEIKMLCIFYIFLDGQSEYEVIWRGGGQGDLLTVFCPFLSDFCNFSYFFQKLSPIFERREELEKRDALLDEEYEDEVEVYDGDRR